MIAIILFLKIQNKWIRFLNTMTRNNLIYNDERKYYRIAEN